jgi:hypothetical protein
MESASGPKTAVGGPKKESAVTFRAAKPEEDDVLSRILSNAFIPIW